MNGGGNLLISSVLEKHYTYKSYKPTVTITDDWVTIEIDTSSIDSQEAAFKHAIQLCEQGNYAAAKPILKELIAQNPSNSEYHRILGQILSDEGDQEEAINCLIDALRWDSKNGFALLMVGNIYAKFHADIDTAMKYYDQALASNKADYITLVNIAYLLFQENKLEEAKKYALEAQSLKPDYPNTSFILCLLAKKENELKSAFFHAIQAIKQAKKGEEIYQNALKQAIDIAKKITDDSKGEKIFLAYKSQLEMQGGIEIEIFEDDEIKTAAKIEFAERHHRDKHRVKYKSNYPAVVHLVMHELVHLDFVLQARKENRNRVFSATQLNKQQFLQTIENTVQKLKTMGVEETLRTKFTDGIFDGLNLQTYNTPIDVFIEDFLFQNYTELRPFQFLSLYNLVHEAIQSVTNERVVEIIPESIVSKTKIFSLVNALQFKELFGLNLLSEFNATPAELQQAEAFYAEFSALKNSRQAGQEFELIKNWAKALKTSSFFELENEAKFESKNNIDDFLRKLENDPFGLNEDEDPLEKMEMEQFQEQQAKIGTNMAIAMFMVDALNHFQHKSTEEIKETALELAMLGTMGIDPTKKEYRISSFPGKLFSGNQILAFYYVTWSLGMPEQVAHLGLDFSGEFEIAKKFNNPTK